MSELHPQGLLPHQVARYEIDSWRGRCLDHYARSERAIAQTLEAALSNGQTIKLRHLAGQRLDDLLLLIEEDKATKKQKEALSSAINRWRVFEDRRAFLAHGIAKELLDRKGEWHALFDLTTYKANKPISDRFTISRTEALELENELEERFKSLSGQLGQFRKRVAP